MNPRKKLIEVALPLWAINEGSKPETENPFLKGHPRALHNWWARTPLSVCRAVLFAQLVDDPGNDLPWAEAKKEREKLLALVSRLATWEGMTDQRLLSEARRLIAQSCGGVMPEVWDMFAGRGSIPLEAQRLGLPVTSSDLNPVAVLIQKALLDIPVRFASCSPVNPDDRTAMEGAAWSGAKGLQRDILYYGAWMRNEAQHRIGHLYPTIRMPSAKSGRGEQSEASVIAWLWARTVRCPNPACGAQMPLVRSFWLSTQDGREAWVQPVVDRVSHSARFEVRTGAGEPPEATVNRRGARCIVCAQAVPFAHVRTEGQEKRMSARLTAIVVEGSRRRVFVAPLLEQEAMAGHASPTWAPESELPNNPRNFNTPNYGLRTLADLFTPRQLVALTTLSDLVPEAREQVHRDAMAAGLHDDGMPLDEGGRGAPAYMTRWRRISPALFPDWPTIAMLCARGTPRTRTSAIYSRGKLSPWPGTMPRRIRWRAS